MQSFQPTDHSKIINWATVVITAKGYVINGAPEIVQDNPWSCVMKFLTDHGGVYLKQTPRDLFIEVPIIQLLRAKVTRSVPEMIDFNQDLYCFLMHESGEASLRTIFNGNLQADVLITMLAIYKEIQKGTIKYIDEFIKMGVPDHRLDKFPELYKNLIKNKRLREEGMTDVEIQKLYQLYPKVCDVCKELESYAMPAVLSHSDFHDNNILLDKKTNKITIIDLGETVIEHPFFSLAACLKNVISRYKLRPEDNNYQKIQAAHFSGWVKPGQDVNKIVDLITKLLPISLTMGQMRLVEATDPSKLKEITRMNSRVKEGMQWFIRGFTED